MTPLQSEIFRISTFSWALFIAYWFYAGLQGKKDQQQEPVNRRILYLSVIILSFGCIYFEPAGINFFTRSLYTPDKLILYTGLFINYAGVIFAIAARLYLGNNWSARVSIKEDHELITSGPYSITRHPIYTGMLFGIIGAAIIQAETRSIPAIILFIAGVHLKISYEEKMMRSQFTAYAEYSRRTRKLIPFLY